MKAGIGIDMGGTRIKIGLVQRGELITTTSIEASAHVTFRERLLQIEKHVDQLLKQFNCTPTGIGLAFPGIVDNEQRKILSRYVKYPDAQQVDLMQWATDRWKIPLTLENDARAALIGEWQYGAGRGCDDLVLVTLGTGVGTGVMINGKLLRGRHFLAGNLGGHMTINLHGNQCNCGNIGCLEAESSTWALPHRLKLADSGEFGTSSLFFEEDVNFQVIFRKAAEGDKLALKLQEDALRAWSFGIINLIHAYDPERIVMGGGIMNSREIIIPYIADMVRKYSWLGEQKLAIVAAKQNENAGILGVCHLLTI